MVLVTTGAKSGPASVRRRWPPSPTATPSTSSARTSVVRPIRRGPTTSWPTPTPRWCSAASGSRSPPACSTSGRRQTVWPTLTAAWPTYDRYEERAARDLRVFRLERSARSGPAAEQGQQLAGVVGVVGNLDGVAEDPRAPARGPPAPATRRGAASAVSASMVVSCSVALARSQPWISASVSIWVRYSPHGTSA